MSAYQYQDFKILEVQGVDTKKFLQGLTTADLNILSPTSNILLTAFANLKGRVISLSFIKYISDDKFLLSVEEGILEILLSWLKKYGMFSKVSFSINDQYALFFTDNGFLKHDILHIGGLEFDISFEEVQKQNILNKLAIIDKKNTEKFLPAELELDNLENVVSYKKGCYMGQEVIARIHYKAKLKKELVVVKTSFDVQEQDLKDQYSKPLANVVNKVFLDNQCYMLVVFHKEATESEYQLEDGHKIIKC
ncbi:amino acid transporter [Allofrancisella guangzhouensis]|uniref:Amino acid transporter n=1 Tax=Allofrancisella guangzhouensis TaxID=594679 RepID=A0A0A8E467_9GAMM|nr:amino acid transporter [Allofrancisella guangzhouensis]AJC49000.1 amino acid transporter [Allofrancisella guangzhouensis]MBK2027905.1 amino acid transporter [Allofrancisella guangzhouensis]MBK2044158.1 amino acid transporter [Allofrancisella guangzhouensis]MBK2045138.1 amino acid transporter [Allofrancisella guangzhouensis]